jgi:hypothetical protein
MTLSYSPAIQIMNLTQASNAYVWTGHPTAETNYTYNGLNQDAAIAAVSGYDETGNLVADGTKTYGYDYGLTRLASVSQGGTQLLGIEYDGMSLIKNLTTATGVTQFLYDGDRLIAEYNGSTGPSLCLSADGGVPGALHARLAGPAATAAGRIDVGVGRVERVAALAGGLAGVLGAGAMARQHRFPAAHRHQVGEFAARAIAACLANGRAGAERPVKPDVDRPRDLAGRLTGQPAIRIAIEERAKPGEAAGLGVPAGSPGEPEVEVLIFREREQRRNMRGRESQSRELQRSWLSLLPRRLMPEITTRLSRPDWQFTQVVTPGRAARRRSGISSPHSTQFSVPSPAGRRARALRTPSVTVSSIWSRTAPSWAQPVAISSPINALF